MKIKIDGKLVFSFALVLLLAFLIYVTMGYNARARLVPMVVLVPGLFFSLIQFGLDLRHALTKAKPADQVPQTSAEKSAEQGEEEEEAKLAPQEKRRREFVAYAWLLGFFVLIVLLGLNAAIPLFVLGFMRFFGRESWKMSAAFAAGCWAFVYGIFVWVLQNEMYPGILLNWFIR